MLYLWQLYHGKPLLASLSHGLTSLFLFFLITYTSYPLLFAQISLIQSLIYFCTDLLVRRDPTKVIHHIISGLSCFVALYSSPEVLIFTGKGCGIMESSNPLWTLFRVRLEKSSEIDLPLWYSKTLGGLTFMTIFFIVRFIWIPIFILQEVPATMPWNVFYPAVISMYGLNIYWMYLLITGAIKELFKKQS